VLERSVFAIVVVVVITVKKTRVIHADASTTHRAREEEEEEGFWILFNKKRTRNWGRLGEARDAPRAAPRRLCLCHVVACA
jgi:hypothetical protein